MDSRFVAQNSVGRLLVARSNATLAMQLQRIVREATNDARRVVYTAGEASEHLAPVLRPDELARMRDFLDEQPASSRRLS